MRARYGSARPAGVAGSAMARRMVATISQSLAVQGGAQRVLVALAVEDAAHRAGQVGPAALQQQGVRASPLPAAFFTPWGEG